MKFKLLSLNLLLTLAAVAQNNNEALKKHALRFNVLSPIYNTLNLSYQHLLSDDKSLVIGASYMDFNDFNNSFNFNNEKINVKGVSAYAEYRLHFNDGIDGFYAAPFIRYQNYKKDASYGVFYNYNNGITTQYSITEKSTYQSAGLGFIMGYQLNIKNIIMIDFFGGPSYQILMESNRNVQNLNKMLTRPSDQLLAESIPNQFLKGYGLRGGIAVGFIF
jgi:hypothetical protein